MLALACIVTGLAGCGGGSGTDNKKVDLLVCSGTDVIRADGTCGKAPPLPNCPGTQIRPTPTAACIDADFVPPTMPETVAEDEAVIYINRADPVKDFSGYSLYTWQDCGGAWLNPSNPDASGANNWDSQTINPISSTPETADPVYGGYFIVKLSPGGTCGNFIVRTPGRATQSANLTIQTANFANPLNRRHFIIESPDTGLVNARQSGVPICINNICAPYEKPALGISDAAAHWVSPSKILWNKAATNLELYVADDRARISSTAEGAVTGGSFVAKLTPDSLTPEELALIPQLSSFHVYKIDLKPELIKNLLKKELVLVGEVGDSKLGTHIQHYALLDALYTAGPGNADEATLGASYIDDKIKVSVWAPTAQLVELRLFSDTPTPTVDGVLGTFPSIATKQMEFDSLTGIWSLTGSKAELDRNYYRFRVTGYNAITNSSQTLEVSDPYAVSLSADGFYSQIVNLNDEDLKPKDWDKQQVAAAVAPEFMSIYEAHVRDFSILDQSTTAAHRGKYLAFTETDSAPVQHLKALKDAGLTHIHLLPINDGSGMRESAGRKYNLDSFVYELCNGVPTASVCASSGSLVNDNANNLATLREVLEGYEGDSVAARELMESLRAVDSFNWNYDAQFFNAPEGSYATKADGVTRIIETRAMNQALHNLGLRVLLDVDYPHMAAAGIEAASATFDKIVPGYYFRNNITSGNLISDTGTGADTATEHVMMGKFLTDSVTQWAKQYKVDGFRFYHSGYIPKSLLVNAYNAVKAVDPDNYFYAEAWTATGTNAGARVAELASQLPLAGTGIGTFNDRLRDPLRNLALVNGGELNAVRAGLTGNLAAFKFLHSSGNTVSATSVRAYNLDPQEAINYVEKHDAATLWDWMHFPNALPADTSLENRARIHALTLSIPLLSQGVPFIQMGSDLLRSKSMDSNSYNSGDWFNRVDFTGQTNNWRVGLPPEQAVTDAQIAAAFADPLSMPTPALIRSSSDIFNEFLTIGKSKLFSLASASDVLDRVGFHDGGVSQVDNLIVMSIDDGAGKVAGSNLDRVDLDTAVDAVVVVFNGSAETVTHRIATATRFTLHPVQLASKDNLVREAHFSEGSTPAAGGTFTVPAYTAAVFVKLQQGGQGAGLLSSITSGYEPAVPYGNDSVFVRGGFPSGWPASNANKLNYEGKGVYSAYIDVAGTATPASYTFLIGGAADNFSDYKFGLGAIALGTAATLVHNGSDMSIALPSGNFRFKLDANTPDAPLLTVTNADIYSGVPLFVRGSLYGVDWIADSGNQLTYEGAGLYSKTLNIEANATPYQFKIANAGWTNATTFGPGNSTLGEGLGELSTNIGVTIAATGNYKFTLDTRIAPHSITVTKAP